MQFDRIAVTLSTVTAALFCVLAPVNSSAQANEETRSDRRPIDEIVVTAQKRTQLLQETPAAVTAIDRATFTVRVDTGPAND